MKEICEGELSSTFLFEAFHASASFKSLLQRFKYVSVKSMTKRKEHARKVFSLAQIINSHLLVQVCNGPKNFKFKIPEEMLAVYQRSYCLTENEEKDDN